jgi:hypothetical protein
MDAKYIKKIERYLKKDLKKIEKRIEFLETERQLLKYELEKEKKNNDEINELTDRLIMFLKDLDE